jgi:trk system potassium uptake protein
VRQSPSSRSRAGRGLATGAWAGATRAGGRPPQRSAFTPPLLLALGFAALIVLGALLLTLPAASVSGRPTGPLDALFTATSAVCVTGLVVVDTADYWSGFGQAVILVLMQLGGLGFMTSATLLLFVFGRRVTLRERLLIRAELGGESLAGLDAIVRRIVAMTLAIEAAGAAVLALRFSREYPPGDALWRGVFYAVSAFTNGSFDLSGGFRSLAPYRQDALILLPIAALIIIGGLGAATLADVARRDGLPRLTLDTKLILSVTGALLLVGTAAVLALEWGNPATLGGLPLGDRLLNAFFHAVVPRTAGFTSLDVPQLTQATQAVTIVLMFIGAAPGSTGGGVKVTTFAVLMAAIVSNVRGRQQVEAFRREIPLPVVVRALTVLLLGLALVVAVAIVLTITEAVTFTVALFEAVSAFATVGLSTGLTPQLSPAGKIVLMLTMFAGRLGPLTLALALAQAQRPVTRRYASEPVKIG